MGDWFRKRTKEEIRDEMRKGNAGKRCEMQYIADKVGDIENELRSMEEKWRQQRRWDRGAFAIGFAAATGGLGVTLLYTARINELNRSLSLGNVTEGSVKSTEHWMFFIASILMFFSIAFVVWALGPVVEAFRGK
jgi:hypothetical protein